MIAGIGTDIIEVLRIAKAIEHWGEHFLNHVFTKDEIAYCQRHKFSAQNFAGRFAAKEAVIKALVDIKDLRWTDIEIINDASGKPRCTVAHKNLRQSIHISISHTDKYATAFAIIEE